MSENEDERARVLHQLRRIAVIGFIRTPGVEGMAEYVAAVRQWPPDLLEVAVSRWIERSAQRFFPFPGELRKMVEVELGERAHAAFERNRQRVLADMRARGMVIIEAGSR